MKCPACGTENRDGARFCQKCGHDMGPENGVTVEAADEIRSGTQPMTDAPEAPSEVAAPAATREGPVTAPLPGLTSAFAPLPEGALVGQERYAVLEVRSTGPHINEYLALDRQPVWVCAQCHHVSEAADERYCESCGAERGDTPTINLRYRLHESADPQAFAQEAQLLALRLQHPGLRLSTAIFTEAPYGPPRQYRVVPEFPLPSAATLSIPQELNTVLAWGVALGQALTYLHRHQVTLQTISPTHIVFDGTTPLWTNLNRACVIPPAQRTTGEALNELLSHDIQGLASVLLYLMTGQTQLSTDMPFSPRLKTLLYQALNTPQALMAETFTAELEACLDELRHPTSATLVAGRRSDVGRVRSLNEDSLLTVEFTSVFKSVCEPVGLYVVADGMGGHEAGDVASELTARVLAQRVTAELLPLLAAGKPLPDGRAWLTAAVQAANQAVYEQRIAAGNDMGNTLTMAFVRGGRALIANIGDSRCYYLDVEGIRQVTVDHSLVERLVATGQITRAEAAQHPQRNVIYRVIGDHPRTEVDLFEQLLDPGSALLLCSDGLSGMVSNEDIWKIWHTSGSPQEACDRLVRAANEAGGEDNVTVIVVQMLA